MWKKEELVLEKQAYCEAEHEEINTAGQTKWESDLWPSDWGPFPKLFFFFNKNEEKQSFADWLIELANRGFGMSTESLNQWKSS